MDAHNFEMNPPTPQLKDNPPPCEKLSHLPWYERREKIKKIRNCHQGIDGGVFRLLEINFLMLVVQICYNSQWMW